MPHIDADDMDREPTPGELDELLQRHVIQLMEHFSSVQIVATRHSDDGTGVFDGGAGDHYARFGAVADWLVCERDRSRRLSRRQQSESDDD